MSNTKACEVGDQFDSLRAAGQQASAGGLATRQAGSRLPRPDLPALSCTEGRQRARKAWTPAHLALVGQVAEVVSQALEHGGVATELGARVLAIGVDVGLAVGEHPDIVPASRSANMVHVNTEQAQHVLRLDPVALG